MSDFPYFFFCLHQPTHRNTFGGVCACMSSLFKASGQFNFIHKMNSVHDVMVHSAMKICAGKKFLWKFFWTSQTEEKLSLCSSHANFSFLPFIIHVTANISWKRLEKRSQGRVKAFLLAWNLIVAFTHQKYCDKLKYSIKCNYKCTLY